MRLRVLSIWGGSLPKRPGEITNFNALLIDENGHTIQATGSPAIGPAMKAALLVNTVVKISNFIVEANLRSYRYAPSPHSIKLTGATTVVEYDGPAVLIPLFTYRFTAFSSLREIAESNINLIDIMGQIIAITYPDSHSAAGKSVPQKIITLRDESHYETQVVLWPPFHDLLDDDMILEKSKEEPVVIACKGMSVRMFTGQVRVWTTSGTTIAINDQMPAPLQPQDRFARVPIKVYDQRDQKKKAMRTAEKKTLSELMSDYHALQRGQVYICAGRIMSVAEDQPWTYKSCLTCSKGVKYMDGSYWCTKCGMMDEFIHRYRVTLTVTDGTTIATVLLFEAAARKLFVLSADDAKKQGEAGSMPLYMKNGVVGIERKFYLMLNSTEGLENKTDFVVNNIEGMDGSSSGDQVRAMMKTPTKKKIGSSSVSDSLALSTPKTIEGAIVVDTPESAVQIAAGIKVEEPSPIMRPVKRTLDFTDEEALSTIRQKAKKQVLSGKKKTKAATSDSELTAGKKKEKTATGAHEPTSKTKKERAPPTESDH